MTYTTHKILTIFTVIYLTIATSETGKKYLNDYRGELFPPKYLVADGVTPTVDDINLYISSLERMVGYCLNKPNRTDVNQGLGLFYTKVLLKRSLKDYDHKIGPLLKSRIKALIYKADYVNTHYIHKNTPYGWSDTEFRGTVNSCNFAFMPNLRPKWLNVSRIFAEDETQVFSIESFNRHRLIKWLLSKTDMNNYSREMDTLALPREKYVYLVSVGTGYHIQIFMSDYCLSRIAYNPIPIDLKEMRPCKYNKRCDKAIHSTPSITYGLSHRMLNVMLVHHLRRCYLRSPEGDRNEMDNMCAFMYREAVYIARRGFFSRDLFLEHIALCGMLGYEEFHRANWFRKAAGWVDEEGCMAETRNFQVNRTAILSKLLRDSKSKTLAKKQRLARKLQLQQLFEYCQTHPMALLKVVLSHAVRYALHNLNGKTE